MLNQLLCNFNLTFSWDSYYDKHIQIDETYHNTKFSVNQILQPKKETAYIFNCFFNAIFSSTTGSAILYSNSDGKFLVEKCFFFECKTDADTSSIRVLNGNAVIAFVCGNLCEAKHNDAFSTMLTGSSQTIKSIFDSSISSCTCSTIIDCECILSYQIYTHQFIK